MRWDVTDPTQRTVLQAAQRWGVSPSQFLGEPRITHYVRDSAGLVVSSYVDPEWTDDDRDAAMELAVYEASLCPGCNGSLHETTDPANEGNYRATSLLCHRCVATEIETNRMQSHPHPAALMMSVQQKVAPDA